MESIAMDNEIRKVLGQHAKLAVDVETLEGTEDLYRVGLTSHASINVMLGLEDVFQVEFPQDMLRRSTFSSIAAIHEALDQLVGSPT